MAMLAPLTDANAQVTPGLFDSLLEQGAFKDVRVELLEGSIVLKMSQGRLHLFALSLLNEALVMAANGSGLLVTTQGTIPMDEDRPEPDAALVNFDPRRQTGTPTGRDVRLAVEIAVSSLAFDRRRKARLYASQGIPEYWIVNPVARQIEIYREPVEDTYESLRVAGEDETIDALALPGSAIRVADLMPMPDPNLD